MPIKTVEARVLLGWMERNQAVKYLREECVFDPPLTEQQAEDIWRPYRRMVDALQPNRECLSPARQALDNLEQKNADAFVKFFRSLPGGAPNIKEVIKVDPVGLVVHQLYVVIDRSNSYCGVADRGAWIRTCLSPSVPPPRAVAVAGIPNGIEYQVPHMEFMAAFTQQFIVQNPGPHVPTICIAPQELAKYVGVCEFQGRTLLWAGYHRSFARMVRTADDAIARSLLMVLTTDADFLLSQASPNQGLRDMITGPCPPLFGDFLDGRFFISLKLRKRRYLLRVTSQIVPVDDDS